MGPKRVFPNLILDHSAFGASGGLFGPFPGHIMELEGCKELVDTGKSSRRWSVPTVSLGLAVLNGFQGFFGPKMAAFGPKLQFLKLRSATCESRSRPPPSSFLLKLCVIVLRTHRYHAPKFCCVRQVHLAENLPRAKHTQNRMETT